MLRTDVSVLYCDPKGPYPGLVADWGHVARKTTWVYCVGIPREAVTPAPYPGRKPTHLVSGFKKSKSRCATSTGSPVPDGIKICSAQQRRRTPPAFAEWLLELAANARR